MPVTDTGIWNVAECELVELCFGESSPVVEIDQESSFGSWQTKYETCLRAIEDSSASKINWSKWLCVAIHFAAFYIDLFQYRALDFVEIQEMAGEHSAEIRNLCTELRGVIHNKFVVRLVEVWLRTIEIERDGSGLPRIGVIRPKSERFISIRTSSEIFLQICGQLSSV